LRVALPARSAPPRGAAAEWGPPPAEAGYRPRLLLIDDEAHLGVTLSVGLRDQADVACVRSGEEAVRMLLADDRFDLILCDLMMPDLTGMDVYEQVSRERPLLRGHFVFTTGGAVPQRARQFLWQGPDPPLPQPP